jgi:hypothetical protein
MLGWGLTVSAGVATGDQGLALALAAVLMEWYIQDRGVSQMLELAYRSAMLQSRSNVPDEQEEEQASGGSHSSRSPHAELASVCGCDVMRRGQRVGVMHGIDRDRACVCQLIESSPDV